MLLSLLGDRSFLLSTILQRGYENAADKICGCDKCGHNVIVVWMFSFDIGWMDLFSKDSDVVSNTLGGGATDSPQTDNTKGLASSSSMEFSNEQEIATLFGEALDTIDFSQVVGVGILETPDDRITQYILQLCGEFLFVTEGYTYPQAFEDSATSLYLISFAFQQLEKGWDGKRLSDFSQVENELGILQYQVDADVIAGCVSDFFAGIDAMAMVEKSECFNPKTHKVSMPMGIGGTVSPFAVAQINPVDGMFFRLSFTGMLSRYPKP